MNATLSSNEFNFTRIYKIWLESARFYKNLQDSKKNCKTLQDHSIFCVIRLCFSRIYNVSIARISGCFGSSSEIISILIKILNYFCWSRGLNPRPSAPKSGTQLTEILLIGYIITVSSSKINFKIAPKLHPMIKSS